MEQERRKNGKYDDGNEDREGEGRNNPRREREERERRKIDTDWGMQIQDRRETMHSNSPGIGLERVR